MGTVNSVQGLDLTTFFHKCFHRPAGRYGSGSYAADITSSSRKDNTTRRVSGLHGKDVAACVHAVSPYRNLPSVNQHCLPLCMPTCAGRHPAKYASHTTSGTWRCWSTNTALHTPSQHTTDHGARDPCSKHATRNAPRRPTSQQHRQHQRFQRLREHSCHGGAPAGRAAAGTEGTAGAAAGDVRSPHQGQAVMRSC